MFVQGNEVVLGFAFKLLFPAGDRQHNVIMCLSSDTTRAFLLEEQMFKQHLHIIVNVFVLDGL